MTARDRAFAMAACVAVGVTIVVGFWETGFPSRQRESAADQRRANDLRDIAREIHQSWISNSSSAGNLPATLGEVMVRPGRPVVGVKDPLTGEAYEYKAGSGSIYRLCAVFATDTENDVLPGARKPFWRHPAAKHCFDLDASADVPHE